MARPLVECLGGAQVAVCLGFRFIGFSYAVRNGLGPLVTGLGLLDFEVRARSRWAESQALNHSVRLDYPQNWRTF